MHYTQFMTKPKLAVDIHISYKADISITPVVQISWV
jgi:hypothetical protein